ncbi:MAG: BCCT family transporter [Pseudomonadota bacterium]
MTFFRAIRPGVFWPPALFLVICVAASLIDFDRFLEASNNANRFILTHLDWLFTSASFAAVLVVVAVFLSPLGRIRIGGENSVPILSRWNWFAITLCTTIAVGILFWGTAEPIAHFTNPPAFSGAEPRSPAAAHFAFSATFLHWTMTPYALYAVTTLAFALSYHNHRQPYSLSAIIAVILGQTDRVKPHPLGAALDMMALFALVAGVAAALGAGVMTLTAGLTRVAGIDQSLISTLMVTAMIVLVFIASSLSGLQKGIRFLSDWNVRLFIALALFIFVAGPSLTVMRLGADGVLAYVTDFIPASLTLGDRSNDPWTKDWTVFFFANWLAWAPITALFLGRISVGYTVREFVLFNLVLPAFFSVIWMTILGGGAIEADRATGGGLATAYADIGPEAVIYGLFDTLPVPGIVTIIFLTTVFISFVTAMDSNTLSIAHLCLKSETPGRSPENVSAQIKLFWGLLIGGLSFIMTATTGIDGVRVLSNLGGVPGLVILILSGVLLIKLMISSVRQKISGT